MNKLISALLLGIPLLLLSGCGVVAYQTTYDNVGYVSGYPNDYVYSVGYNTTPTCLGTRYYARYRTCGGNAYYYTSGYGLGNYGYWGSYY